MKQQHSIDKLLIFHMDFNYVSLKVDYIKKWLEKVASLGYNAILWEIEDKIQWEHCADCNWPEAMNKETFQEVLSYSRELGLEPIPLLQTIGHGEYILKHDNYKHLRELADHHDCYCTSNPAVRQFLKQWISEYLQVFGDINYFHLGGDEAYVFAKCPECESYAAEHGKNKLYAEHILDVAEELLANNIRPGIWCDMILHYPDQVGDIPTEFVIWDWNYWSDDNSTEQTRIWGKGLIRKENVTDDDKAAIPELVDEKGDFVPYYTSDMLKRLGYDVILCSASRSAGDSFFCPRFKLHVNNIAGAARKTVTSDLLGNCVTSWAIRLNCHETQELSIMMAPQTMKNPEKPADILLREIADNLLGQDSSQLLDALDKIGDGFIFIQAHSTGVQWNSLKDSLPAPKGYIRDLIKRWSDDPEKWQCLKDGHQDVIINLQEGIRQINELLPTLNQGFEFVETWSHAGQLQYWHAMVAQQLFAQNTNSEIKKLIPVMKENAINFFSRWETPQSAEKNAGLIYDCLAEYFE